MRGLALHLSFSAACLFALVSCTNTVGDDPLAASDEDDPDFQPLLDWQPDKGLDSDLAACDPGSEGCDALVDLDVEDDTTATATATGTIASLTATGARTWPNGIIPYVIDGSVDAATRRALGQAMTNWQTQTENRIRFRSRRSSDSVYLRIVHGDIPLTKGVGAPASGAITMELRYSEYVTVIKHEIGHIVGFRHEQKRMDRGDYIKVLSGNIKQTSLCEYQFVKDANADRDEPYDRVSIMHYRTTDLRTCRTGPVLERLDGSSINHEWNLSRKDLEAVAKMYKAPATCRPETVTQMCSRLGKECGTVTAKDNCGDSRTVDCGQCSGTEVPAWTGDLQENGSLASDGKCTTVDDESTFEGAPIMTSSCVAGDNQDWYVTVHQHLRAKHSLACMSVQGEATIGLPVVQSACNADDQAQVWITSNMELVNGRTGQCATIPSANYAAGQLVTISGCTGVSAQKLSFSGESGHLKAGGLCLTPENGAAPGHRVVLASCDDRTSQRWLQARGGFVNRADTSQCLRLAGGDGTHLETADCDDSTGQRWALRGSVKDKRAGLCLTSSAIDGGLLTLRACTGSEAQAFTFWSR